VPTYDYRCKACGDELEVFQSFSEDPLTTCEACGGELRKLFGAPGIAFKGSGFYKNDSRGSKKSTVSASSDTGSSDKTSSDSSSSEKSSDSSSSEKSSSDSSSSNGTASSKKETAAASPSKGDSSS
jgi:putative FmdB family regulatory protein